MQRLQSFTGVPYYWGGESTRGIDCSGLPRRALRDALFSYAVNHMNSRALRMSAEQWWFDASAKALGEGYRHYTIKLQTEGKIKEMPYDHLLPGDLVVTRGGSHTLVYLGDDKWIQADPGARKVTILNGRKSDNNWFEAPVTSHRWLVLESKK